MAWAFFASARAEGWLDAVGFDGLSDCAEQRGFDAAGFLKGLLTGQATGGADALKSWVEALATEARAMLTTLARRLMIPVAVCAALRLAVGRGAGSGMADLACALCCAAALSEVFLTAREEARTLIEAQLELVQTLTPVMVSACALGGAPATAGLLAPMAAEGANLAAYALQDAGISLCSAAGAVAVAGCLSGRFPLNRLFLLIKSLVKGLLGATALLFGALVTVQGTLGASRDSAAVRAAKTALDALAPVIGGGLSDPAGALAVSAATLRRAVGFTGAALALYACAGPLMRLAAAMLSAKLAAALLEPLSMGPAARLCGQFGELMELLMAICVTCGIITALLAGGCAACLGAAG